MPHIQKVWDTYGEKPLSSKGTIGQRRKLQAFVGGEVYFSEPHTYTNEAGDVYLSGSQYAKQFEKPFDSISISNAIGKKFDVPAQDVAEMWKLKAEVSKTFGTALHSALELYGRYRELAGKIEKETHLHDHPVIKKAVQGFYESRRGEKAELEVLVVDHKAKRAGRIDRLLITGEKKCRVQDFKTNATIEKNLENYGYQLDFYSQIMEANGWTVEGQDLFHWDGNWKTHNIERKVK